MTERRNARLTEGQRPVTRVQNGQRPVKLVIQQVGGETHGQRPVTTVTVQTTPPPPPQVPDK
ncbi:hypothetical protein GCM10009556_074910 [Acrocarpospora pleiomorpha]